VSLDCRLVEDLRQHRRTRLVFRHPNRTTDEPADLPRDIWMPLVKQVGLPRRVLYSLRATFASLARASGEAAFNVPRMMGHSGSAVVDQVHAGSLQSGLASVASAVPTRVLGDALKLRVIEDGVRDVATSLPEGLVEPKKAIASV
jgi:integrase